MTEPKPLALTALLAEAEKAAKALDWDGAADLLKDCPPVIDALDKRAFYLSRAKRYDEACEVLTVLREMEPANFLWQYMTGYQFYAQQRYRDAIPWFVEAYRRKPDHIGNLYRLAQCRRNENNLDKAMAGFAQVLKLWHSASQDVQTRDAHTLAKASYQLGKHQAQRDAEGAIPLLEQAVKYDAGDHDKHYLLGKTYRRVGRLERGLKELEHAQRIKPGLAYIELELAHALASASRADEAAPLFVRATRSLKGWQAWKGARIAIEMGRLDDARRLLAVAGRSSEVRRSPKFEELNAMLPSLPAQAPPRREDERRPGRQKRRGPQPGTAATGTIHHIRPERGFGFLVDDSDHERCYFKLAEGQELAPGQAVSFARYVTSRGPAARDVKAAA